MNARSFLIGSLALALALGMQAFGQAQPAPRPTSDLPAGKTYYVSTSGSDRNIGTPNRPWRSIQKAADSVGPFDTVIIADGVYHERIVARRSGRYFGGFIHFQAAEGAQVIVDGDDAPAQTAPLFDTAGHDYIDLSGLTFRNNGGGWGIGISITGSWNVTLENCHVSNTDASGIMVDKSAFVTITGCEVDHACRGRGEETISIKRSRNCEVSHSHIHDTGHEGIDVKEGSQTVWISFNRLEGVQRQALYADAWDSPTKDIWFSDNDIKDCQFGMAACSEAGGLLSNVWFYNNVACDCHGPGMVAADWGSEGKKHPLQDIYFINNTLYHNRNGGVTGTWAGGMDLEGNQAHNIIVCNNIFSQNGPQQIVVKPAGPPQADWTISNNLIDGPSTVTGNGSISGKPQFRNPDAGDFRLNAGSPASGAGRKIELGNPDDLTDPAHQPPCDLGASRP
jgi:parallel beta-helix repeat protein